MSFATLEKFLTVVLDHAARLVVSRRSAMSSAPRWRWSLFSITVISIPLLMEREVRFRHGDDHQRASAVVASPVAMLVMGRGRHAVP
jgi:hypothetical protein